jgi:hypothetical protein
MTKLTMASTCSTFVGHFDGHGGPPVQYKAHRPMQHSRATLEATGCRHWATTGSVSPQRLPGQQQTRQQQQNVPKRLAISMAAVVRWYNTARMA